MWNLTYDKQNGRDDCIFYTYDSGRLTVGRMSE